MNGLTIPPVVRSGLNASPDLIMGLAFLATWIEPTALGSDMHKYFVTIMLLEFMTIHSAAFMAFAIIAGTSKFKKFLRVIGLGVFYSLFIIAFTADQGEYWPLIAFWLMILNRIFTMLFDDSEPLGRYAVMTASWAWGVFCYIMAIAFTTILPLPAFGWTFEYLATISGNASGLWFDTPQALMAAGFLYFSAVALFELYSHRIVAKISIDPKNTFFGKKP